MSLSECNFHGEQQSYHCGYCNGQKQKPRCTYGATFSTLTVEDYQCMTNRGWRRSGTYCYKPVMNEMCCPQYVIRCDMSRFQLGRGHRRLLRRMDKFLRSGEVPPAAKQAAATAAVGATSAKQQANNSNAAEAATAAGGKRRMPAAEPAPSSGRDGGEVDGAGDAAASGTASGRGRLRVGKARQKRWARRLERLHAKAAAAADSGGLDAVLGTYRARRAARAAARAPRSLEQLLEAEGRPRAPAASGAAEKAPPPEPRHRLRIVTLPSARSEFDPGAEHPLYRRYQVAVHGDSPNECSLQQFRRFLCDSPLAYARRGDRWLGSFHQQYWLEPESRLIMVGVLDVLPDYTSSVYVFYDPEFAWLNLGTYAALREIAYTRKLGLPHYCMGFYIHDCVKMRYKGAFSGSQLLCPETYTWHCLRTVCQPKLDVSSYCRFAPESVADAASAEVSPEELQVALGRRSSEFVPYRQLAGLFRGHPDGLVVEQLLRDFARLVGPESSRRIRVRLC